METTKDNIYAATEANLIVAEELPGLYVVATRKFWALYVATIGTYALYWFYKNWSLYKNSGGDNVWPIPRGIFHIFFVHSLCEIISGRIRRKGIAYGWPAGTFATTYVLFAIIASICDRLAGKGIGSPVTDVLSVITLPVTGWALWKIQMAVNVACEDPAGDSNREFTGPNVLWMVFGAALWVLVLAALILSDQTA